MVELIVIAVLYMQYGNLAYVQLGIGKHFLMTSKLTF